jgi:hypothetical protein
MLRLYGVPVAPDDALWLIDQLRQVGRADDLTAAAMIEKGVQDELIMVALTVDPKTTHSDGSSGSSACFEEAVPPQ